MCHKGIVNQIDKIKQERQIARENFANDLKYFSWSPFEEIRLLIEKGEYFILPPGSEKFDWLGKMKNLQNIIRNASELKPSDTENRKEKEKIIYSNLLRNPKNGDYYIDYIKFVLENIEENIETEENIQRLINFITTINLENSNKKMKFLRELKSIFDDEIKGYSMLEKYEDLFKKIASEKYIDLSAKLEIIEKISNNINCFFDQNVQQNLHNIFQKTAKLKKGNEPEQL